MRIKDGEQLAASGTRDAFGQLSDTLVAEGHPEIVVVSGDRDPAYQERIWYERMVPVSQVDGRRTYGGVKWWRGVAWIRISPAGDVAVPGTSQHEAKRAADLGWPYNNRYTLAHARCVQLAPRFGIEWTGRNFGEDWHFENRGPLGSVGTPAGGKEEDDMTEPHVVAMIQDIQNKLSIQNAGYGRPEVIQQRVDSILGRILPAGAPWDMLQLIESTARQTLNAVTDDTFDVQTAFDSMKAELLTAFEKQFADFSVVIRAEILAGLPDAASPAEIEQRIDLALSKLRITVSG